MDGEKMGYLPGDIDEKTAPYMMSLYYNMKQIIGKQRLDVLLDHMSCNCNTSERLYERTNLNQ